MYISLKLDEILKYHQKIITESGGSQGVKDIKLLDSALNRANATFSGVDLYKTIEEKISVTTHSLISNHCFIDGNKRIGISTMVLLCKLNEISIEYSQSELITLGLEVASNIADETYILNWIKKHKQ
ncbi:type II toxin-antitoxin system death-on-curing family toxin [Clostridioides sp. ES-S-0108-01]|uniref:type II toxin-antitoxin system death-on-curing family toxin n=1 Tax=unclassified Clostridioides TaxID=2635829 RepID=UPI001D0C159A|nr:type II toxin-antitoxin system death-on-curing family toxin [Clostridioides sp. ES-S-0107-01]MCC0784519.1 type II toxin-antitoxin system death-on-curing family toxin [Clostridioides sp. ES-S-0108-01]UDN53071.1 type II toxin-antitoxin system death-on-curing family toxin [Clostridioides sp. ES-S-0107-01]